MPRLECCSQFSKIYPCSYFYVSLVILRQTSYPCNLINEIRYVYINLLLKQLNFIFKKGNLYSWIRNNGIPISKVCKEFFYSRCKYLRIRWKIILHYSNISFLREIFLLFQNKLARLVFSFIHRFIFLYNSYVKLNETTYKKLKNHHRNIMN